MAVGIWGIEASKWTMKWMLPNYQQSNGGNQQINKLSTAPPSSEPITNTAISLLSVSHGASEGIWGYPRGTHQLRYDGVIISYPSNVEKRMTWKWESQKQYNIGFDFGVCSG